MPIRNSVKAILIHEGRILLIRNQDHVGEYYICPGGGQEHGETFHDALLRECIEETGQHVEIGELLFIREYIGKNHDYAAVDFDRHQVEFYFECRLKDERAIQPTNPDSEQVGVGWVPIHDLLELRFYPMEMRKHIVGHFDGETSPIYFGDIN